MFMKAGCRRDQNLDKVLKPKDWQLERKYLQEKWGKSGRRVLPKPINDTKEVENNKSKS